MNSTPEFLVGEKVARQMDGVEGTVVEVSTYHGEFSYKVDLGRTPLEGLEDDCWWGNEQAWRHICRTHAHVRTTSRDCDGTYEHSHIDRPSAIERTSDFGDLEFKERVMGNTVSFDAENGKMNVNPQGLLWMQRTDEGYIHTEVVWCDEDDCDDKPTQRDLRAESMGY